MDGQHRWGVRGMSWGERDHPLLILPGHWEIPASALPNSPCPHSWNQELKPVWVGDFVFDLWVPPAEIEREPDPSLCIVFVPQDLH